MTLDIRGSSVSGFFELSTIRASGLFSSPCPLESRLHAWLDYGQQILPIQVGAGTAIRKPPALARPCVMNCTTPGHPFVGLKNTGPIFLYLEGIPGLHVFLSNYPIRDPKVPGQPVYVFSCYQQDRSVQAITAVSRAIITVIHIPYHNVSFFGEKAKYWQRALLSP